jgi:hypothetical protein
MDDSMDKLLQMCTCAWRGKLGGRLLEMTQWLKSTVVVSDFRRYKLCETVARYSSSPKDPAVAAATAVVAAAAATTTTSIVAVAGIKFDQPASPVYSHSSKIN